MLSDGFIRMKLEPDQAYSVSEAARAVSISLFQPPVKPQPFSKPYPVDHTRQRRRRPPNP